MLPLESSCWATFWLVVLESSYFENSLETYSFFLIQRTLKCLCKCIMIIYTMIMLFLKCLYYVEVVALLLQYLCLMRWMVDDERWRMIVMEEPGWWLTFLKHLSESSGVLKCFGNKWLLAEDELWLGTGALIHWETQGSRLVDIFLSTHALCFILWIPFEVVKMAYKL